MTTSTQTPRAKHAEDFIFGETLGHGSFGDVIKAVDKETGQEFAIKVIEKALVVKLNKQKYVVTERDILSACNHPNIVRLYYTFRSETSLHYVLELCPGGELLKYIRQTKSFSMPVAQFYTAEIVNALEHLHKKGFVHRDLKPENVLLSSTLHVKLTDFGTAKNLKAEASAGKPRTNSFVGTAEYVPPEVLTAPSVAEPGADDVPLITTSADLWSLGCIVYQMLTGKYPFRGKSDMLTFEKIKNRDLYIPPNLPSEAADFISKLLVLDPSKRLGANCDFESLKAHPFFAGITFDGLWKQTPPAFEPFPTPLDWSGAEDAGEQAPPVAAAIEPSPAVAAMVLEESTPKAGEKKTELTVDAKATKEYEKFFKPGEDVYLMRTVQRLYALHSKTQILLLTTTPRIVFLSASEKSPTKVVKEIPWDLSLSFGVMKDPSKFFIQIGSSQKKFKDLEHNASKVLTAFEEVMRRHRQSAVPDQ